MSLRSISRDRCSASSSKKFLMGKGCPQAGPRGADEKTGKTVLPFVLRVCKRRPEETVSVIKGNDDWRAKNDDGREGGGDLLTAV